MNVRHIYPSTSPVPKNTTNVAPDTRVLCDISSDLSAADEKRFTEKNKNFWSLKKHYFRIEYSVRVLIGAADIRFELWFNDQKLSRDQSIKVEWTPTPAPIPKQLLPKDSESYLPANGRAELADAPPMQMSGALVDMPEGGKGIERTSTAVVMKDTSSDEKRKRGMGGLLARARGKKTLYSLS
jgi:hypothetical protein